MELPNLMEEDQWGTKGINIVSVSMT
jgi:hypothetical protein